MSAERIPAEIISAKRWGRKLSVRDIEYMVAAFQRGDVSRAQMAALAMAICTMKMDRAETMALTEAMWKSGMTLQWPEGRAKVDKHSTGGIGDKISIPLAPLLACLGMDVPMISGRGLGFTGGTLDKLESIPGYRIAQPLDELQRITSAVGCCIAGASSELAPADQMLYRLRDETGTVESVELITASILSKKLSAGLQALILDVKWGSGAFMPEYSLARDLARSLVAVGNALGMRTRALMTDMNQPIGRMVGHSVEIDESVEVLQGGGPADVRALTVRMAAELMEMAGLQSDRVKGERQAADELDSGRGYEKLQQMVAAQGGDLQAPRHRQRAQEFVADRSGFLTAVGGREIGYALVAMGGGRRVESDRIDHAVGFEILARVGERVQAGDVLAKIYFDGDVSAIRERLRTAFQIGDEAVEAPPLINEVIDE